MIKEARRMLEEARLQLTRLQARLPKEGEDGLDWRPGREYTLGLPWPLVELHCLGLGVAGLLALWIGVRMLEGLGRAFRNDFVLTRSQIRATPEEVTFDHQNMGRGFFGTMSAQLSAGDFNALTKGVIETFGEERVLPLGQGRMGGYQLPPRQPRIVVIGSEGQSRPPLLEERIPNQVPGPGGVQREEGEIFDIVRRFLD